jgi:hypothetical protein
LDTYDAWLADFRRRLVQHDESVRALARDLASRTEWTVRAIGSPEFSAPPPAAGQPPDVSCERSGHSTLCLEVELPETLVRRATVRRLGELARQPALEPWIVLVGASDSHERQIAQARRMLRRAGLATLQVAAIAPDEETITGADW